MDYTQEAGESLQKAPLWGLMRIKAALLQPPFTESALVLDTRGALLLRPSCV